MERISEYGRLGALNAQGIHYETAEAQGHYVMISCHYAHTTRSYHYAIKLSGHTIREKGDRQLTLCRQNA